MNRHFSKEDIQMANKYMNKCSTSLDIREIQIITKMRYHLIPVRMTKINKSGKDRCWWGCGERGTFTHCWWQCKLVQPLWKTVWSPLKKKNGQQTWTDISPKKTYKWPTDTWKKAQHHLASGKYKSKPPWDTASHLSEWLKWTSQETTNVDEDVEKKTLMHWWWECKLVQPLWKTIWRSLKKLKIEELLGGSVS